MQIELHPEARNELQELDEATRMELLERLRELKEQPTRHDDSEPIEVRGRTVFRFTMKEGGRGGRLDYRAIYDVRGEKVVVYAVFHRDRGYRKGSIARRF